MPKIYLIDVTNRDGVQTANLGLAKIEKTIINQFLDQMGVFQSEFGFPMTHHDSNYLNANIELRKKGGLKQIQLSGWLRAVSKDVKCAYEKVPHLQHVNLSIPTSDQMIRGKFSGRMDRRAIIRSMQEAVETAYGFGAVTVGVNAEDAGRTGLDHLVKFALAAKDVGATRIRYCDTVGQDDPFSIYERVHALASETGMPVELHCHNDLAMAVANSIAGAKAAVDAGQDAYINTTINGIGERAGNADLVAVALAMRHGSTFRGRKYKMQDLDLTKAWQMAEYASYSFGVPIPINQPGVGSNAFAHASGIHADGALKDRRNYELYDFTDLGRGELVQFETGRRIVTGEYGGLAAFRHVYRKEFDIEFPDNHEANRILELVRYVNVQKQKPVTKEELLFVAQYPSITRKLLTMIPPE